MSNNDNPSFSPLALFFMIPLMVFTVAFTIWLTRPEELPRHEIVRTADKDETGQKISVKEEVFRNDDGTTVVIFTTN